MVSFSATLEINKLEYVVVRCTYNFTQAIGARGRVNERVRHGLLEVTLNVPDGAHGNLLLLWASTPHYPLDGHVSFHDDSPFSARETVSFKGGECVSYQETFEVGSEVLGSYHCSLIIAAPKLELATGSPLTSSSLSTGSTASLASAEQTYTTAQQAKASATQVNEANSAKKRKRDDSSDSEQVPLAPAQSQPSQDNIANSKRKRDDSSDSGQAKKRSN